MTFFSTPMARQFVGFDSLFDELNEMAAAISFSSSNKLSNPTNWRAIGVLKNVISVSFYKASVRPQFLFISKPGRFRYCGLL